MRMTRNAPLNSLLDDLSVSFRVHFSTCNERTDILVDLVGCLQIMAIGLRLSIFQKCELGSFMACFVCPNNGSSPHSTSK